MTAHDTRCSKCGGPLKPTPSFTEVRWECDCGGQTAPKAKSRPMTILEIMGAYSPASQLTLLLVEQMGVDFRDGGLKVSGLKYDASTDLMTGKIVACLKYPTLIGHPYGIPAESEDLWEVV